MLKWLMQKVWLKKAVTCEARCAATSAVRTREKPSCVQAVSGDRSQPGQREVANSCSCAARGWALLPAGHAGVHVAYLKEIRLCVSDMSLSRGA